MPPSFPPPRFRLARPRLAALAFCLFLPLALPGADAAAPANRAERDEAVVLAPFAVVGDPHDSYEAHNTQGVTGTNRAIASLPLSMDAFTRTFIDEIAATDINEVLQFAANVEDIQDTGGGGNGEGQRFRIRGLLSAEERRRDGFLTTSRIDTYNLERVEVLRGPQALLHGQGISSGTISSATKRASATNPLREVRFQTDSHGTQRYTVDLNQGVGGKVGVRFNGLWSEQRFWQEHLSNRTEGGTVDLVVHLTPRLRVRTGFEYLEMRGQLRGLNSADFTFVDNSGTDARTGQKVGALLAAGNTAGIIVGGEPIAWDNYASIMGGYSANEQRDRNFLAAVEAEPMRGLYLRVAFNQATSKNNKYINNNVRDLLAPTDSRAVARQYSVRIDPSRNFNDRFGQALQAAAVYQFTLGDFVANQVVLGGEARLKNQTFGAQSLYQLDAAGNFLPGTQDGGRRRVTVAGVPVQNELPGFPDFTDLRWGFRATPTPRHEKQDAAYLNWLGTWFKGRCESMMGVRIDRARLTNVLINAGTVDPLFDHREPTGLIGGVFRVTRAVAVYANYAKSFLGVTTLRRDPDNELLPVSTGYGREAGVKLDLFDARVSGSLAYYENDSSNESVNMGAATQNIIDPNGLNGRNGDIFVPIPLGTRGYEVALTLRPLPSWRVQLGAGVTDGHFQAEHARPIFYNDEFNTVRLPDGTMAVGQRLASGAIGPLMVPTLRNVATSASVPLTLDMLRAPASASSYGATLNPISGQITNAAAIRLNTAGVPTGATGLPLSRHQLGFVAPNNGTYLIQANGDKTYGYPESSLHLNTNYRFTARPLRGFSLGGTFQYRHRPRQGYVTIGGVRQLHYQPDVTATGLRLGYQRKFERATWTSQLAIPNVLQRQIEVRVLNANGGTDQIVRGDIPRTLVWTNTLAF